MGISYPHFNQKMTFFDLLSTTKLKLVTPVEESEAEAW